jgi:tetrathionate reductase subunit B
MAMVIDLNRCVGCLACSVACLRENVVRQQGSGLEAPNELFQYARTRPIDFPAIENVKVPDLPPMTPLFIQCQHCENPPCVAACPTGASYVTEEGVVILRKERCIGCRACMIACPYGARTMYLGELGGEPPNPYGLEPKYPDKCTFCYHRKATGRWVPACVEACAFGARIFGDLDDPSSEVSRLARSGLAVRLREELGTRPKVIYVLPRR